MSIYTLIPEEVVPDPEDFDLRLTERDIYGSSRLGTENINQVIASTIRGHININTDLTQVVGDKNYELSNLPTTFGIGNVLQVVTDRKLAQDNGVYDPITGLYSSATEDGIVDYYTSDVVSQSDYYPFGMLLPGRNSSEDEYRYGFNGMEMDDEVSGKGNSYDFGARLYNSRVGRWLSRDPQESSYPSLAPYQFVDNSPIKFIDPDGEKIIVPSESQDGVMSYLNEVGIDRAFRFGEQGKMKTNTFWILTHRRQLIKNPDQKYLFKSMKRQVRKYKTVYHVNITDKQPWVVSRPKYEGLPQHEFTEYSNQNPAKDGGRSFDEKEADYAYMHAGDGNMVDVDRMPQSTFRNNQIRVHVDIVLNTEFTDELNLCGESGVVENSEASMFFHLIFDDLDNGDVTADNATRRLLGLQERDGSDTQNDVGVNASTKYVHYDPKEALEAYEKVLNKKNENGKKEKK
jgi:RHS repeat-associated protein